jgi:single-strand DNA-binding protein
MSDGLNKVILYGNLGAEPDLRLTAKGLPVLSFRMATTEVYYDKEGSKQERTEWHSVTVFGKRAEALAKILGKGSRVLVEGRIHNSSYEKDGQKRTRSEVVASDLFLAPRAGARGATNGAFARPPAPEATFDDADLPF